MKNFIKNNLKQRIWLIGCVTLLFILFRPMMQLMTYENEKRWSLSAETLIMTMEKFFLPDVFTDYLPTAAACIVIAIAFFSYLFSKKRVDLFHSIPVDRKHLFISNYISGVIVYEIALLAEYIICALIAIPNHYMTATSWKYLLTALCINTVHFLFGYAVVICGIMLAGNAIVGIAGASVIALIFPVTVTLFNYFRGYFFVTYFGFNDVKPDLLTKYYWLSPVTSYATLIQRTKYQWDSLYFDSLAKSFIALIMPAIITLILTGVAYFLYMKRPSEAAGRAISFKKLRVFIEVPIVFLAGLIGSWFMSISINSFKTSWIWIGAVLGVILSHFILEAIINESFKSIVSHKIQLILTLAATLLVIGAFYVDIFNYDTYIPKRDAIESAGIHFNDIDVNVSLMNVKEDINNPGYYTTEYVDGIKEAFVNTFTNDKLIDSIYEISEIGVSNVPEMIKEKYDSNIDPYGYSEAVYEDVMEYDGENDYDVEGLSDEEAYKQALLWMEENGIIELNHNSGPKKIYTKICYKLKNGKVILREYCVPLSVVLNSIDEIYKTKEFKDVHFDLREGFENGVIHKVDIYDSFENRVASVSNKEKDEVLKTYLKELDNLNIDIISNAPIGRISPLVRVSEVYDESYSGYYLYPEFKETLALLESYGVDISSLTNEINADEILSMNLSSYNLYGYSEDNTLYLENLSYNDENDAAYIKEIAPMLVNASNIWSNQTLISNKTNYDSLGVDIVINMTPVKGIQRSCSVMLKDGKLPEKMKKDIIIRLWEENHN